MRPFRPLFKHPHVLTIAANYWPRKIDLARFPVRERLYRTEPDVQVLALEQRPEGQAKGELLLVHGLEGSSDSGYQRSMAQAALEAGFAVHRINLRSCGGTEQLCKTLYHAGLTSDLHHILKELEAEGRGPMWAVGYSLGGNVVLKLAGELGESATPLLRGVAGICTPIDLSACVTALERLQNRAYEMRFVRNMKRRMRERHRTLPDLFPIDGLEKIRSVRGLDDRITGPMFGFGGAEGYYGTQSAIKFVDRIRIPTLLLFAQDDPMVPAGMFGHPAVTGNPHIRVVPVEHGGHLGFLAADRPRFWLDGVILEWIDGTMGEGKSS